MTRPTGKVPGYKNVITRAYYLKNQHAGKIPARRLWSVSLMEKTREPGEKPSQACTEQATRADITKHKCRDIGLPDGMGAPNRQAAKGDPSTGTTVLGHCAIASQTLIFLRHAPAPPISETPGIYPSLTFQKRQEPPSRH